MLIGNVGLIMLGENGACFGDQKLVPENENNVGKLLDSKRLVYITLGCSYSCVHINKCIVFMCPVVVI